MAKTIDMQAMKIIMLAEDIMEFFENEKGGIASDLAWYELINQVEMLITGKIKDKDFIPYVEMVFGFDDQDELDKVKKISEERFNEFYKMLTGEDGDKND